MGYNYKLTIDEIMYKVGYKKNLVQNLVLELTLLLTVYEEYISLTIYFIRLQISKKCVYLLHNNGWPKGCYENKLRRSDPY